MKKLWILLVALAMVAAAPIFAADVSLSGELQMNVGTDFKAAQDIDWTKVELNLTSKIDDFNTLKLEFDAEHADFPDAVKIDDIRLETDFGAALGLPITLKGTFGYFDTYFYGGYYWTTVYWTYNDFDLISPGNNLGGDMQIDLGLGPVTVHWYNDGAGDDFAVGAEASFMGASVYVDYAAEWADLANTGVLDAEAKYDLDFGDFTGGVGAFFSLGLGADTWAWGVNLGADYGMFHLGAGAAGTDADAFDLMVVEATVAPADPAMIYAALYVGDETAANGLDFADTYTIDIGGTYKVGGAKFGVGYQIGKGDVNTIASGDNWGPDNGGLYAMVDVDY